MAKSKKFMVYCQLLGNVRDMDVFITPQPGISSNDCVKIINAENNKSIYCFVRLIDADYRKYYQDNNNYEVSIDGVEGIVLCSYYRRLLGIEEVLSETTLYVSKADNLIAKTRAFLSSPDQVVRVTSMLGLWSVFLGALGGLLGLFSILKAFNLF